MICLREIRYHFLEKIAIEAYLNRYPLTNDVYMHVSHINEMIATKFAGVTVDLIDIHRGVIETITPSMSERRVSEYAQTKICQNVVKALVACAMKF